ncbi:unnamed protein product [Candidula unifasciata]|uniref:U11/U12 small nuclear ribonucleoprotein 35 kDa protein n=1 Tax=Candidula unifasciata TaxID=100452 RepID=A0A8S3ZLC8_9EUPU|nr:unnamed protein product [Candidula unifasciata]
METFAPVFVESYDPLKAGSIDGTDELPHDRAVSRACAAKYKPNKFVRGDKKCTVFIGHLSPNTTEQMITKSFKEFGQINFVRVVRDIVTGSSKCYAFVEFQDSYDARSAVNNGHKMVVDGHEVLVEHEKERTLKGWIPRRLGGGLGGKRESGQLRFGGKDRPFRRPIFRSDTDRPKPNINSTDARPRSRSATREPIRRTERHRSRDFSRGRGRQRSRDRSRNRDRQKSRDRSISRERLKSRDRDHSKSRERHRSRDRYRRK